MSLHVAEAKAVEPGCTDVFSAECPVCRTSVDTSSETCARCGWPVKWISRKSDTPPPAAPPRRASGYVPYAPPRERRSRFLSALIYVGAAAVLATTAWWLQQDAPQTAPMETSAAAPSASVATESAPIPAAVAEMHPQSTANSGEGRSVRGREVTDAAPAVVDEPPAAAPAASVAAAPRREVQAWQTADGKLYFGDAPPPGSKQLNVITHPPEVARAQSAPAAANPDRVELASARSAPSVPAVSASEAERPMPVSYAWRTGANCKPDAAFEGMRIQVDSVRQQQTITGRLKNTGATLIKDVTVCRGGACTSVAGGRVLQARESAPFTLLVSRIDWDPIAIACTVLERN